MGEKDFLRILARVIKLYKEIRIYNTAYRAFTYELKESYGKLILTISYPLSSNITEITYDTRIEDVESKLDEVEKHLKEKREYIQTSRFQL